MTVKKNVVGFPGYIVSSDGRIWSKLRNGEYQQLKPTIARGYYQVSLTKNKKTYYRKIHHVVLQAFVGTRPGPKEEYEACHNNGNRLDNRVVNLRWGTKSDNYQDRHQHGTSNDGERNGRAIITERDVIYIRRQLKLGVRQVDLAAQFGICQVMVSRIKLRKAWDHVEEVVE